MLQEITVQVCFNKTCSLITHFSEVFSALFFRTAVQSLPLHLLGAGCWLWHRAWQQTRAPRASSCGLCAATAAPSATTARASTKGIIILCSTKSPRKEIPLAAKHSWAQCSSLLPPSVLSSPSALQGCYGKHWEKWTQCSIKETTAKKAFLGHFHSCPERGRWVDGFISLMLQV